MKILAVALALIVAAVTAQAQPAPPDIRGTWTGKGKSLVYGTNPHHPGGQPATQPPRVRAFEFAYVVEGQDGRLAWGRNSSKAAATNEPFAWAISSDGKTIVGTDTDGYYNITLQSADLMEVCYAHAGVSPSGSIVATCHMASRTKK